MLATTERDDSSTATDGYAFLGNGQLKLAQAIADFRTVLAGPSIQVRCLECPTVAPARVAPRCRSAGFARRVAVLN